MMSDQDVISVMVTYEPDEETFDRISILLSQTKHLIVVDNGSNAAFRQKILEFSQKTPSLTLIQNTQNLGIARALNQGLEAAESMGGQWCLTIDQDTILRPDAINYLMSEVAKLDNHVAAIGCNFTNADGKEYFKSDAQLGKTRQVSMVITSGCLTSIPGWRKTRGFRDEMFIDSVDHDFCLRLQDAGMTVWQTDRVLMTHKMGNPVTKKILGYPLTVPNYSPARRYYRSRNRIMMARWHWRREPMFVTRELINILSDILLVVFYESQKRFKLKSSLRGIWHGLCGNMSNFRT